MLCPLTFYKCLSEDTRLKILLLIATRGELCVCDLTTALQLSQPKVSRHLAELRKCGLLSDQRKGKWVYYQFNSNLPDWAVDVLQNTAKNNPQYIDSLLSMLDTQQDTCTRS
ncbi:metalloregulator ArsR/SmtB family transcription factor [Catenovulum sediminis]|uniref:Metalloregulator ArsR/SmtB family transcription factor n=1 Tax=Catenovulum sediminis TaxID=1740262 RepID=A0ABV1RJE5_9ALTE